MTARHKCPSACSENLKRPISSQLPRVNIPETIWHRKDIDDIGNIHLAAKHYRSAGLVIESDFELPGLVEYHIGSKPTDLRYVHALREPHPPVAPTMRGSNWSSDESSFHLTVPDVAVFDVSVDGTVKVWPKANEQRDIAAYLVGSVLGIALHFRKIVTIHASAVQVGEGAVLFCGDSGAGKSTMAAAFQRNGFCVLSDDLCALEISDASVVTHSDGRKLKLWQDTIGALGLHSSKGDPVQKRIDKFFVDSKTVSEAILPVCAVFELVSTEGQGGPRTLELSLADAAAMIRRNAYRPFLVQHLNDEILYFETAVALLRQAGLYKLERPFEYDEIDKVVQAVTRRVQGPCKC